MPPVELLTEKLATPSSGELLRSGALRRLMLLGTFTFGTAAFIARASSMLVILVISRLVSPTDVGVIAYILAVYTVANVVADLGLSTCIPRFVPRASQPRKLVVHALVLRLVASITLAFAIWSSDVAWGIFRGSGAQIAFLVACSTFSLAVPVLDANLRFVASGLTRGVVGITWMLGAVVLTQLGLPVWGPVLAYGLATVLVGLPTVWLCLRHYGDGLAWSTVRELVPFGIRVVGVLTFGAVASQAGLVILAYARGDEAAAMYRVASIVAAPPALLAAAIGDPLVNLVARIDASDDPGTNRVLLRPVMTVVLATAGIMVPLGLLLGPEAVQVFGRGEYNRSVGLLNLLVAANALGMLTSISMGVMYALGELRVLLRTTGAMALTTVVATFLMLPSLGDLSAGVAQVLANALLVVLLGNWFRRYLHGSINGAAMYWPLGLTGAAFVVSVMFVSAPVWERAAAVLLILAAYGSLLLSLLRPAFFVRAIK